MAAPPRLAAALALALVAAVAPSMARAGRADPGYAWPLELAPVLSSTFGETRPAAFHAGVDLKTEGRTGFAVRAVADGYVWRVRTSPWGYGRSLYQKTADGRIVVYGHLQRFAPAVAARVDRAQEEQLRYTVDLTFAPSELPVRRGEAIAWSGQSGTGGPHLHLELRTEDNQPINPLTHGFAAPDTVPPSLPRLGFVPMGLGSQVQGRAEPHTVALVQTSGQEAWAAADTPTVWGPIGVVALVFDRAGSTSGYLAPYRLELRVDGQLWFAAAYEQYSYSDAHQVWLDRRWLDFDSGGGVFNCLYRLPGNRLGFYDTGPERDGFLRCGTELPKGLHRIQVTAEDVAGHRCIGSAVLLVDAVPTVTAARIAEEGGHPEFSAVLGDEDDGELRATLERAVGEGWESCGEREVAPGPLRWPLPVPEGLWRVRVRDASDAESWASAGHAVPSSGSRPVEWTVAQAAHPRFVELVLRAHEALAASPTVQTSDGGQPPVRQTGPAEWRVEVPVAAGPGAETVVAAPGQDLLGGTTVAQVRLSRQPLRPGQAARLEWDDGRAVLEAGAGCAYDTLFPQAQGLEAAVPAHLGSCGVAYAFGPEEVSFDEPAIVWLQYPPGTHDPVRLAVYREGKPGEWGFAGNRLDPDRRLVGAEVRRLGCLALLADREPPAVEVLRPAAGSEVASGRPALVARVADRGAGIGREEDLRMELDGQTVVCEYDPEVDTLEANLFHDVAPGRHRLVVWARDRSGNEATAQVEFTVAAAERR